jgi:hypothetical protein
MQIKSEDYFLLIHAQNNYPIVFTFYAGNLIRSAQSVANISETVISDHKNNMELSTVSLGNEAKSAQRAKGRTFAEKRHNNVLYFNSSLWFT